MSEPTLRPVGTEFELTYPPDWRENKPPVFTTFCYRVTAHLPTSVSEWSDVVVMREALDVIASSERPLTHDELTAWYREAIR